MTADRRLDAVMAAIHAGRPEPDEDTTDHEAEWEMRHDHQMEYERAEDRYERELDRGWEW